jgi:hypothetical protein
MSSAGNPISLPSIIMLGVYSVLLFTEDLNALLVRSPKDVN